MPEMAAPHHQRPEHPGGHLRRRPIRPAQLQRRTVRHARPGACRDHGSQRAEGGVEDGDHQRTCSTAFRDCRQPRSRARPSYRRGQEGHRRRAVLRPRRARVRSGRCAVWRVGPHGHRHRGAQVLSAVLLLAVPDDARDGPQPRAGQAVRLDDGRPVRHPARLLAELPRRREPGPDDLRLAAPEPRHQGRT